MARLDLEEMERDSHDGMVGEGRLRNNTRALVDRVRELEAALAQSLAVTASAVEYVDADLYCLCVQREASDAKVEAESARRSAKNRLVAETHIYRALNRRA